MEAIFTAALIKEIEAVMHPKQKRAVNFLIGQCMKKNKSLDPVALRHVLISKLVAMTYQEK